MAKANKSVVFFPNKPPDEIGQKILVDLTIITISVSMFATPFKRGFHCDDTSLRYPYRENSIPTWLNYCYSLAIPIILIAINEFKSLHEKRIESSTDSFWKLYFWYLYLNIIPFLFAVVSTGLITIFTKFCVGRYRPHFIDRCQPMLSNGRILYRNSLCTNLTQYITDFYCTNGDAYKEWNKVFGPSLFDSFEKRIFRDVHLSFFSGHASLSAVCMVYMVMYADLRIKWSKILLMKELLQTILVLLALFTGLSRVSDCNHHWSDVVVGLGVGSAVAIITALYVADMADGPRPPANPLITMVNKIK